MKLPLRAKRTRKLSSTLAKLTALSQNAQKAISELQQNPTNEQLRRARKSCGRLQATFQQIHALMNPNLDSSKKTLYLLGLYGGDNGQKRTHGATRNNSKVDERRTLLKGARVLPAAGQTRKTGSHKDT
jgi:hypothetical protein